MIEEMIGSYGNRLLLAVAGVGGALVLLVGILWLMRRRGPSSPFIKGGKNRQPRLQVLDAAAIDARRRLVLVRRDNVEHLVMIGGPTDIVIESGISNRDASAATLRPINEQEFPALGADIPVALPASRPAALAPPVPAPPPEAAAPVARPATITAAAPAPQPPPAAAPAQPAAPAPAPAVVRAPSPTPVQEARPRPQAAPQPARTAAPAAVAPPATPVIDPPVTRPQPEPVRDDNDIQKEARSEFERILEAEMASRVSGSAPPVRDEHVAPPVRREPVAPPAPAPPVIAARQVAAPAPAQEPVPDAEVQKEIARIFGEMSASRDK